MSDFETLLERLLLDPAFKAALEADPHRALAGYVLSDDEREILMAQLSGDAGQSMRMEERTSKAALFGLLGAVTEIFAPSGLAHLDTNGVPQPTASDSPTVPNMWWKSGYVQPADFSHAPPPDYSKLLDEIGIPADDGASKDPGYIDIDWDDPGAVDKAVPDPPTAQDAFKPPPEVFKAATGAVIPPPPEEIQFDPPAPIHEAGAGTQFDPPAPIHEAVTGKSDLPLVIKMAPVGIKMAPGGDELGDIKGAPGPELPNR